MTRHITALCLTRGLRRVACVLVPHPKQSGRFLCVTRRGECQKIGLPAGKVEPDESPECAAVRELLEETGIRALELRRVFVGRWEDCLVETFLAVRWDGEPTGREPGIQVFWGSLSGLYAGPDAPEAPWQWSPFWEYNRALFSSMNRRKRRGVSLYQRARSYVFRRLIQDPVDDTRRDYWLLDGL